MVTLAESVEVREGPTPLRAASTSGQLAVVATTNPRADAPAWPMMGCYAVLASWRSAPFRVAMFVTYTRTAQLTVNLVYRDQDYGAERMAADPDEGLITAAVGVGRWLFGTGRLEAHSPDRTDAGDKWAHAVSPDPCPREHVQSKFDSAAEGRRILDLLNRSPLPSFPR